MPDSAPEPQSGSALTSEVWERLRAFVQTPPVFIQHDGRWNPNGEFESFAPVPYPPANKEQLRQTEAELGFPLPFALNRFYAEIANGGRHIGPVSLLYGATDGCRRSGITGQETIGQFASRSDWRMHPAIEEALLHHLGRYVLVDSLSKGFLLLGEIEGYNDTTVLDTLTGRVYQTSYPYWFSVLPTTGGEQNISRLCLEAPSLGAWSARWLDNLTGHIPAERWPQIAHGPLTDDMVETSDLPDPEVAWRGLYRFGPGWWQEQPVGADLIENINQWIDGDND